MSTHATHQDNDHRGNPDHRTHRGHGHGRRGFRRAMRARRWMRENPSTAEVIAMLEEYQRDLEQEVESVASRIRDLRAESGDDA